MKIRSFIVLSAFLFAAFSQAFAQVIYIASNGGSKISTYDAATGVVINSNFITSSRRGQAARCY